MCLSERFVRRKVIHFESHAFRVIVFIQFQAEDTFHASITLCASSGFFALLRFSFLSLFLPNFIRLSNDFNGASRQLVCYLPAGRINKATMWFRVTLWIGQLARRITWVANQNSLASLEQIYAQFTCILCPFCSDFRLSVCVFCSRADLIGYYRTETRTAHDLYGRVRKNGASML